ncbi:MAG: histidine--tRNA ligase [Planctomycetaceae bacterium]
MTDKLIKPQTLKGFRDFLPAAALTRERLVDTAKRVYRNFGYAPIDTPALEYTEILLGKGGDETDKQMFRFEDAGGRDVAMRFDLTIPFARFAAQHSQELGLPFKRYHVGTVWRGERPQKGRFREFVQCDFDTIGTDSPASDAETLLVIHDLLVSLGFERFSIRINHRGVLNGLLEKLGAGDRGPSVLRALDKLAKAGREAVVLELVEVAGLSTEAAEAVLTFSERTGPPKEILSEIAKELDGVGAAARGIETLRLLLDAAEASGVPASRLRLDLSIARGLDYYTGTIYETFLDDLPGIGSVCSGGRYDNLAGLFTKLPLPGVGASLGVDRLLAAMEELGLVAGAATPAEVLVTQFEPGRTTDYVAVASRLRRQGIAVEVYPETKKVGKQLEYANRKGHRLVLIAGPDEFTAGTWQVKTLATGEQQTVADAELVDAVQQLLNPV